MRATVSAIIMLVFGAAFAVPQDFARTGYDGGPSPLKLQRQWSYTGDGFSMFLATPAVANARVYAATCGFDMGMTYGAVTCLAADGTRVWETGAADGRNFKGFFSSPVVSEDGARVLIGEGLHMDGNSRLICLDAATGAVCWAIAAPDNHFESSPAVLGDMVVCGAGAIETDDGAPPADPGFVLAVRISDGQELWRAPVVDPESPPAIDPDGTVYVGAGLNGCAVVALRSESDDMLAALGLPRERWRTPVAHPATGSVTLDGDRVLIGIGRGDYVRPAAEPAGGVICLDRHTGKVLWNTELGDVVLGPIAARAGVAYAPMRGGSLVALRATDGVKLWSRLVATDSPLLAGPAVSETRAYAVSANGLLAVIDLNTGNIVERKALSATPGVQNLTTASPIIANGRLYTAGEVGGVRCWAGN